MSEESAKVCLEQQSNESTNAKSCVNNDRTDAGASRETFSSSTVNVSTTDNQTSKVHWYDNVYLLLCVIFYVGDVGTDMLVSVVYFKNENYVWFALTLTCVIGASLVMMGFSLSWYYDDTSPEVGKMKTVILHVLQLGPLQRYWNCYRNGRRCREKNVPADYYNIYLVQWRDITMLRLFEVFLESAPQLVLQLYILAYRRHFDNKRDWLTALSACFSLIAISSAIVTYTKALRDVRKDKGKLTWWGFGCQIVWRLLMVASRITTLVLFASVYKSWILLMIGLHWLVMSIWIFQQRTTFISASAKLTKPVFSIVVGFIYLFCFFNINDEFTRRPLVKFYTLMFIENCVLIFLWFPHRHEYGVIFVAAMAMVFGGFFVGVLALILYHQYYHPSLPKQGLCIRTSHVVPSSEGIVYRMLCCDTCCFVRCYEDEEISPSTQSMTGDDNAPRDTVGLGVVNPATGRPSDGSTSPKLENELLFHQASPLQMQYLLDRRDKLKKEKAAKAKQKSDQKLSLVSTHSNHSSTLENGTVVPSSYAPEPVGQNPFAESDKRNDDDDYDDDVTSKRSGSLSPERKSLENSHDENMKEMLITESVVDANSNRKGLLSQDKKLRQPHAVNNDGWPNLDTKKNSDSGCDDFDHPGTEAEKNTICDDKVDGGSAQEQKPQIDAGKNSNKVLKFGKEVMDEERRARDTYMHSTCIPLQNSADILNFRNRYSFVADCISISSSSSSNNDDDQEDGRKTSQQDMVETGNESSYLSEQFLLRKTGNEDCSTGFENVSLQRPKKRHANGRSKQGNRVSFPNFVATNLRQGRFSSLRLSPDDCTGTDEDIHPHFVEFSNDSSRI